MIAPPRPLTLAEASALLREGDVLDLCARAGAGRSSAEAGCREDGAVLLVGAARPPADSGSPREVHLRGRAVGDLRARFPAAWFHADAPHDGVDSLGVSTGRAEEPGGDWERLLDLPHLKVAAATYGPDTPPEALARRLERLRGARNLRCVVWLPDHPGDLVYLPHRTTDGSRDAALLAVTRLFLPPVVRVRASWAGYGWKLAQVALAFGIDEVAGWGLEEEVAWGADARPASVVGLEEALAGVLEARRKPVEVRGCAWES